jgi:hypothetical protein
MATRGEIVRKPFIARKLHRNMHNIMFFAIFGSNRDMIGMQHTYVRVFLVQQSAYTIKKKLINPHKNDCKSVYMDGPMS